MLINSLKCSKIRIQHDRAPDTPPLDIFPKYKTPLWKANMIKSFLNAPITLAGPWHPGTLTLWALITVCCSYSYTSPFSCSCSWFSWFSCYPPCPSLFLMVLFLYLVSCCFIPWMSPFLAECCRAAISFLQGLGEKKSTNCKGPLTNYVSGPRGEGGLENADNRWQRGRGVREMLTIADNGAPCWGELMIDTYLSMRGKKHGDFMSRKSLLYEHKIYQKKQNCNVQGGLISHFYVLLLYSCFFFT